MGYNSTKKKMVLFRFKDIFILKGKQIKNFDKHLNICDISNDKRCNIIKLLR